MGGKTPRPLEQALIAWWFVGISLPGHFEIEAPGTQPLTGMMSRFRNRCPILSGTSAFDGRILKGLSAFHIANQFGMPGICVHIMAMMFPRIASSEEPRLQRRACKFFLRGGFTLVEVTLALGLTTFAVMAVVGLLPVGLGGLRQAAEDTVRAQIIKEMDARLGMADSSTLFATTPGNSAPLQAWFNHDGQLLRSGTDPSARFRVVTTQQAPQFPGSANANAAADSLRVFQIQIEDLRTQATNKAVLHVANSGH